jgi:hypothetical protein
MRSAARPFATNRRTMLICTPYHSHEAALNMISSGPSELMRFNWHMKMQRMEIPGIFRRNGVTVLKDGLYSEGNCI